MKRLVLSLAVVIALASAKSEACDRSFSRSVVVSKPAIAVAVPLVVEDTGFFSAAHVLAAPVISPVVVVERRVFTPRVRVQVFGSRRSVRLFAR